MSNIARLSAAPLDPRNRIALASVLAGRVSMSCSGTGGSSQPSTGTGIRPGTAAVLATPRSSTHPPVTTGTGEEIRSDG